MSVTFAKVLEYYVLEETSEIYEPSSYQFGYISGRNTQMASSLMHDIGVHCNLQGTPIFHCSLDAAGAYDDIPHSVLFDSATALPDHCWRLMVNWYSDLYAKIKWNNQYLKQFLYLKELGKAGCPRRYCLICFINH